MILSASITSNVYAQVDAGGLQQGLEKQLTLPTPLQLPELDRGAVDAVRQSKEEIVRFTVNQFQLEGVKILPEAEVQNLLKAWLDRPVTF